MFTPELVNYEEGSCLLVANHCLIGEEATKLSVEFNRARILFGMKHLPPEIDKIYLRYDIRGQRISNKKLNSIREMFSDICYVDFLSD